MSSKSEKTLQLLSQSGSPPVVLAPMVEVNDRAFRILCRRHGIKLCWTGMINAKMWVEHPNEREKYFQTCPEDRPLVIQLSGNDKDDIISCAKDLEHLCDAIDINLGCSQHIARRGQYGHFMVNTEAKRDATVELIRNVVSEINLPLFIKLRPVDDDAEQPDPQKTVDFAKRLVDAGVSLISVHGRQKRLQKAGDVDTSIIKAVVDSVSVPVLANGGIMSKEDADTLRTVTGAYGTMVGQGLLMNPKMFDEDPIPNPVEIAREYLSIFTDENFFAARRHMFYLLQDQVKANPELGDKLKTTHSIDDIKQFLSEYEVSK